MRRGNFATVCRGIKRCLEHRQGRRWQTLVRLHPAMRQIAAEGFAPRFEIRDFGRIVRRLVKRNLAFQGFVRDGHAQIVTHHAHNAIAELLGLVRRIARLGGLAQTVPLDRFDQQDGGLPLM
jgi:hypothetical protein